MKDGKREDERGKEEKLKRNRELERLKGSWSRKGEEV